MCEVCGKQVTTYVVTSFNNFIVPLVIFVFYFYGLVYSLPLLLITFPLFKNVTHSCPYCFEVLQVKSFYPIQFKDKVKFKK
jgi:hypothetical protein